MKDKVVVITGASSGIGAEAARLFAEQGASVVLLARSEAKMARLASSLPGKNGWFVCDVADAEEVSETAARILERFGKIDIWINNAGFGVFERFENAPLEHFYGMMQVNYFGTLHGIKAALPHMLEQKSGHIINVASMAGKIGSAKSSAYSAAKHAVIGLSDCLRQELSGSGVKVSTVNPGPVDTPFFDTADPQGHYKKNISWFMLTPQKAAKAIVKAARTGRAEINIPLAAAVGVKGYHLFPRLMDRLLAKVVNKK